jgi:hypothetical protein
MSGRAAVVLAGVLLVVGVLAHPAEAEAGPPAGIGLRLADGPIDAAGGLATDRISHVLPAGGSEQWTVEVVNSGPEPRVIPLTVGAAELVDGQFRPADGAAGAELPDWVTIDPSSPLVPGGGRVQATVTVDVPDDATDGDHAAAVWASATSHGPVTQVHRVGLRALITVADGVPAAGFAISDITVEPAGEGHASIAVEVANTGGRMVEVAGELSLEDGPGGVSAGELRLLPTSIAMGTSEVLRAPVDPDLPTGRWTVDVRIVGDGLSDESSTTLMLGSQPAEADGEGRAAVIALAVLLLLLTVVALLLARRGSEDEDGVEGALPPQVDDARAHEPAPV